VSRIGSIIYGDLFGYAIISFALNRFNLYPESCDFLISELERMRDFGPLKRGLYRNAYEQYRERNNSGYFPFGKAEWHRFLSPNNETEQIDGKPNDQRYDEKHN
jgi:hypothetical protein